MQCPFCKDEMEKGFLQGGTMMVWVKKKHYISMLPKDGEVLLGRDHFTGVVLPSWICKKCRRVITEYEDVKNEF